MEGFILCSCKKEEELFSNHGFLVNENYNFYFNDYGAFMGNIVINKCLRLDKYFGEEGSFKQYKEMGYDLILGPAAPTQGGFIQKNTVGVYCPHYHELIAKKLEKTRI